MFSICSISESRYQSRASPVAALCLVMLLAPPLSASNLQQVEHPRVLERMAVMKTAKAALEPLVDMMSGRILFDPVQAGSARRILLRATREIPRKFRKFHQDPMSNARHDIWTHWDVFTQRAKTARQATRALRTNSLTGLRKTLPDVIHSCLACHKAFRKPP